MKYLYMNKYWKINEEYNLDKLLYSMIDRPNQINKYNNGYIGYVWSDNKGYYHRNYDLPEYFCNEDYNLHWYKNVLRHRDNNKPAIIFCNGYKHYYKHGERIKIEQPK